MKPKHFDYQEPDIKAEIYEEEEAFTILLTSKSFAKFVELDLEDADAIFDDNIFDMTAGKTKKVTVQKDDITCPLTLNEFKQQFKIRSLFDTYE